MGDWELIFYIGLSIVIVIGCISYFIDDFNKQKIEKHFEKADRGDVEAQTDIAYGFEQQGDYAQAFHWYRRAAEQGYAPAQHALANCYQVGIGVSIDYSHAEYWYRRAAEQGQTISQFCLSTICLENSDTLQSMFWLNQSAEHGASFAQKCLAGYYLEGFLVPLDKNSALYWYEKAIRNEDNVLTAEEITELRILISKLKAESFSSLRANVNFETINDWYSSEFESERSSNNIESDYKIFEIDPSATDDEVKKAYYDQIAKHHPDKVSHLGEHIKKFAEGHCAKLNEAYERIKKERERKKIQKGVLCPNCQGHNDSENRFCISCGTELKIGV